MRKTFVSRPASSRKQRGVAIVFSLGILGLLTVLALGFASTALLNNSISKNVMNDAYARTLAKNLALTQAVSIINSKTAEIGRGFVDYRNIYSWTPDTDPNFNKKDFLLKLDCKLPGKGSDGTDQSVYLYYYIPSYADDPSGNVRWQYVKDSAQEKILGRYAYVVVPEKGALSPTVNTSTAAPTAANLTAENIKDLERYVTLGTTTLGDMVNNDVRWTSYGELIAKCQWSKAYSYNNMFKFFGISPELAMKTPEAYREDDKLYARFNLNRTDWAADAESPVTPEKLCGEGITLKEFKNEDGEIQQQECIPWLKKMYDNESTQNQALQIAANIIQYNRVSTAASVSNSDDWLTDDESKQVKYIGIGRHPMLNELGFMVHVKASVEAALVSEDPEHGKATYRYTPKYYVTLDAGSELLYQCGAVSGITKTSEVTLRGNIQVELGKFKEESELQSAIGTLITDGAMGSDGLNGKTTLTVALDAATAPTSTAEGDPVTTFTGTGYGWTGFKLSFAKTTSGWNSDPAYTKSSLFWKRQQGSTPKTQCLVIELPSFQLETETSLGAAGDISIPLAKGMRVESINIDPKKVLLKYNSVNRDFVQSLEPYKMETACDFKPAEASDPAAEHAWFVAYETTDPLVNLKKEDWTKKTTPDASPAVGTIETLTADPTAYPGSIYDSAGEDKHVNNTLTADSFSGSHEEALLKLYGNITDTGTTVPEPAYTSGRRLPTGIIRHGQILSFWELGCISRGKPFETLNLLKKSGPSPDFSYDKGDAVLFDQLKLSDNDYTEGKINLNAERHKVLEQIFSVTSNYGFLRQSATASKVSALAYRKEIHKSTAANLLAAGSADRSCVKTVQQTAPTSKNDKYPLKQDPAHEDCLICSLLKATEHYCIQNRGDLLLDHADLPAAGGTVPIEDDWNALQDLLQYGATYLEKIQIAAKIMPILRTEPADVLYVVVVAQSIKDMGGNAIVTKDWDNTGLENSSSWSTAAKKKALYAAGFRRTSTGSAITGVTEPTFPSKKNAADDGGYKFFTIYSHNTYGQYDLGSDKITGEARLLATLVRDPETNKWKLLRVQNVD